MTLLLPLWSRAVSPESRAEALRNLLKMPTMSVGVGWNFSDRGLVLSGSEATPAEKVAQLRKEMDGTLVDADRYLQLALLYDDLKDDENSKKCASKAVELFRRRVELQPDNGRLLSEYARALFADNSCAEAEAALRKAVLIAPKDGKCWENLGLYLSGQSLNQFVFGGDAKPDQPANEALKKRLENVAKPSTDQLAHAQKLFNEAVQCFDKLIEVSPTNAAAYASRGTFYYRHWGMRAGVGVARADSPNLQKELNSSFADSAVADFRKAADLAPDDSSIVGECMFVEYTVGMPKTKPMEGKHKTIDLLGADYAKSIRTKLATLEDLGKSSNAKAAAAALTMAAVWRSTLYNDTREGLADAQRAVDLDPSCESGWQMLMAALVHYDNDELIKVCKAHLERNKDATNRMHLAAAYFDAKQFQNAEEQVNAILETDPEDFKGNVASAVLILRRAQKLSEMIAAEQRLRRAFERVKREAKSQDEAREPMFDVMLTHAIYCGMNDLNDEARQLVDTVLEADPENKRAKDIFAVLKTN